METKEITRIAGNILWIDPDGIDTSQSLFDTYNMDSLQFIDFSYELKAATGKNVVPESLWPVSVLLEDPECYARGAWTGTGKARLRDLFGYLDELPECLDRKELRNLFSVDFVAHRLSVL